MNEEVIIDVINRLIGDYKPCGETNHDNESNDNLIVLCNIVAYYIKELYKITKNSKRVEFSIRHSGLIADDLFQEILEYFKDWEAENAQNKENSSQTD